MTAGAGGRLRRWAALFAGGYREGRGISDARRGADSVAASYELAALLNDTATRATQVYDAAGALLDRIAAARPELLEVAELSLTRRIVELEHRLAGIDQRLATAGAALAAGHPSAEAHPVEALEDERIDVLDDLNHYRAVRQRARRLAGEDTG